MKIISNKSLEYFTKKLKQRTTEWKDLEYAEGFSAGNLNGRLRYRLEGKHVFIEAMVRGTYSSTSSNQGFTIANLPDEIKPKYCKYSLNNATGDRYVRVGVTPNILFLDCVYNWKTQKLDNTELVWFDASIDYWLD